MQSLNNFFSIITVVKNDQNNIEKTIRSVLSQNNKNFEYIIIDGNSSDNTLNIVNKYKNNIDILISENDLGIYDAINKGIKLSNGSLIGICNSGDVLSLNALSKIEKIFNIFNCDAVFGTVKRNYLGKTIIKSGFNINRIYYNFDFATSHSTGFYVKKKVHNELGFYDTNFKCSADYDFFFRMVNSKNYVFKSTNRDEIIGEVASGGFSSRFTFLDHLNEETKIRLKNKQNILLILIIYLNAILKNLKKIIYEKK
jgi:glycosyltransferase involved in cell wall biosynthesis